MLRLALTLLALAALSTAGAQPASSPAPKPALTVAAVQPRSETWAQALSATGSLAAWREVAIGTEAAGQRIEAVLVDVGQRVKKGQLLARLHSASLEAELAATRANLAEAQATAQEAQASAARVLGLKDSPAISAQQGDQAQAQAAAAQARVAALQARVRADELRLAHTRVLAPFDGVISQREAIEGALPQPGASLFMLIRDGRLEWRAELPAAELARIQPGARAQVLPAGASAPLEGRVRVVAPTVDAATRNGRVYVDLTQAGTAKAGMFARGEFLLGERAVLTLPQTAVLLRDGFAYVFELEPGNRVRQRKVSIGRRQGERVELVAGVQPQARVVAQGVGFLADNDVVRVAP